MISLLARSALYSLIGMAIYGATPLLSRWFQAKWLHRLWIALALFFLIPLQIPDRPMATTVIEIPAAPVSALQRAPTERFFTHLIPAESEARPSLMQIDIPAILCVLYIFGALTVLLHALFHHRALRRRIWRFSEPPDDGTAALYQALLSEYGLSGVPLIMSPLITGPMLVGVKRPFVALPKDLPLDPEELTLVLRHELTHYRRRDVWARLLMLIARAVYWFNPLMYLFSRAEESLSEIACDAEFLTGTDAQTRYAYVQTLLGVIRANSMRRTALCTRFSGGKRILKRRITSIMDMKIKRMGAFLLVLLLVAALYAGTTISFAMQADDAEPEFVEDLPTDDLAQDEGESVNPTEGISLSELSGIPLLPTAIGFSEYDEATGEAVISGEETYAYRPYADLVLSGEVLDEWQLTVNSESHSDSQELLKTAIDQVLNYCRLTGDESISDYSARRLSQAIDEGIFSLVYESLKEFDGDAGEDLRTDILLRFESREMLTELTHYIQSMPAGLRSDIALAMYEVYANDFAYTAAAGGEGSEQAYSELMYMQSVVGEWVDAKLVMY